MNDPFGGRPPRLRFAPSPTGFFHVGGARTALYNWVLAKRLGGTFVLRVEDTDEARNHPDWTQGILDALAWLEIAPDDPTFEGPYFQSQNAPAHVEAAERLLAAGDAYYCDCTRDDVVARTGSQHGGYDRFCRDRALEPGPGRALRFRVPDGATVVDDLVRGRVEFENDTIEDFVLLRSNGTPMFLLANVVDDMTQGITGVIRAEEHLPNTPKQQLLWVALGAPAPPMWAHVPVLVNEQRKKLSKRRDQVALEQYRDEGYLMEAMRNYLMTLGWAPSGDQEIVPWQRIVDEFRLEDVNKAPAFFDVKKLDAFNGEYIRALDVTAFIDAAEPWLLRWLEDHPTARYDSAVFAAMAPHVQTRVVRLDEVPGYVDFLLLPEPEFDEASWAKAMKPPAGELLVEVIAAYSSVPWEADALKAALEEIGTRHGQKLGKAQAPVRVAVTGRTVGPPLFESLEQLGRESTLARLQAASERLVVGSSPA
jgi:glutamyl-tRNA synthetase